MAFYEKSTTAKPGQRAWRPLAIAAERAFWRDADALFARFDDSARRPLTVIQSCRPEALEVLGAAATYDIALIGLDCGRSKVNVDTARADRLHAVMRRLDDVDARGCVDSALASTISAKEALDHAVKVLCENLLPAAGGRPDPKAVAALCRTISPDARFWSRLGREFNEFSRELRGDLTAAEGRFLRRVLAVTAECFASAIDAAPESGGAARARAVSQQLLDRSLRDLRRDRQVGSTEEVPHA
jgi:hypothetical protein